MTLLELEGISKKGKERIKQHGTQWEVIKKSKVAFAPGDHILIKAPGGNSRWITEDDKDFRIINKTKGTL